MPTCARCGKDGPFYDDICDIVGDEAVKCVFHLCKGCQHEYYLMTKGFLEGRE